MIRTLKATLGLGLLAALAMSAIGVMGASAEKSGHFTSDSPSGKTKLDISEVTGTGHQVVLSAVGSTVECHHATYTAHFTGSTTQEITVTPEYTNCTTGSGGSATVTMNGCHYQFTSRSSGHATVHFKCPVGAKAQVHTGAGTLTFGEQTPSNGVVYTTTTENGKHALTVDITATGITAECHGLCQFVSPTTIHNATMNGAVTVNGTDADAPANFVNITST